VQIQFMRIAVTYLKARADGAIKRGRPGSKEAKTDAAAEKEQSCMSG